MFMEMQILQDLGFTNAEIKIYLSLLELGSATAGPIIEKSKLQSSVVHASLNKLITKGFVSFVKENNKNHYQATNPEHMLEYIEDKKKKFKEILPTLIKKQNSSKQQPETTMFKGVSGIKELLYELLNAGGTEHQTIGSPGISNAIMSEDWWISYHVKRAARGIKAQLIFNTSLKEYKSSAQYPNSKTKYTDFGPDEPLTETIIRNDKVGIIIWTAIPVGILMNNKAAASSYRKYFKYLWKSIK